MAVQPMTAPMPMRAVAVCVGLSAVIVAGQDGIGTSVQMRTNAVTTTVDEMATSKSGYSTFRLSANLARTSQNLYAIYGRPGSSLSMPPAFQVPAPFGTNLGGVNPQFFDVNADAEFDSWLSVGITDGSSSGGISSVGVEWTEWTESSGIETDDGAVFWMSPDDGPTAVAGPVVVAQLTVPVGTSFTASAGAQGRSVAGADWDEESLVWCQGTNCIEREPCDNLRKATVDGCVGSDENGPIAGSHGCDACVAQMDVFIGIVTPPGGVACMMPNGMAADHMMRCLCADPPTCERGETLHNTAIDNMFQPPPAPPPSGEVSNPFARSCPALPPVAAGYDWSIVGTSAMMQCPPGSVVDMDGQLVPSIQLTCVDNEWSPNPNPFWECQRPPPSPPANPFAQNDCSAPEAIPAGYAWTISGNTATMECPAGATVEVNGQPLSTIQLTCVDSAWSPQPDPLWACRAPAPPPANPFAQNTCPPLQPITAGYDWRISGDTAVMECPAGAAVDIEGEKLSTVQLSCSSSAWSPQPSRDWACQLPVCDIGSQPSADGTCQACMNNHYSPDGRGCLICPPGSGVYDGRASCNPCAGDLYSTDGVACTRCESGKQPNDEHTACVVTDSQSQVEIEDDIVSAVVTEYRVDGVVGYTTYRVALHVEGDAANVYTIYGESGSEQMELPGARQVAEPFGTNVGGVSPSFYSINEESEFDSWVTIGMTDAAIAGAISSIGIEWSEWTESSGLQISDGAVFWMNPDDGPSVTDADPVVLQLTMLSTCQFHGLLNAQGRTISGSVDGNWDARSIQFHGGAATAGACSPPPVPGTIQPSPSPPPRPPPPPPPPLPANVPPPPSASSITCIDAPVCATNYNLIFNQAASSGNAVCELWSPDIRTAVVAALQPPLPDGVAIEQLCPLACQATACMTSSPAPPSLQPPSPTPTPLGPGCTTPVPEVAGGAYTVQFGGTTATLACSDGLELSNEGHLISCSGDIWGPTIGTCTSIAPPTTPSPPSCLDDPICTTNYATVFGQAQAAGMAVCEHWTPATRIQVAAALQPPLPEGVSMEQLCPVSCQASNCDVLRPPPPPPPPDVRPPPPPTPPPTPSPLDSDEGCVNDPVCSTSSYATTLGQAQAAGMAVCEHWTPATRSQVAAVLQPPLPEGVSMEQLCPVSCQATTCNGGSVYPSPPPPGVIRPPPPPPPPPPSPSPSPSPSPRPVRPPPPPPPTVCTASFPTVTGGTYGFHGALRGTAATLVCDPGRIPSQNSMITCANNVWSAPGTCDCGPGQAEPSDGSRYCVPCGEGTFRAAYDRSGQCHQCAPNTQPNADRSDCVPCPAGMSTYTCEVDYSGSRTCGAHPTCRHISPPPSSPPSPAQFVPPTSQTQGDSYTKPDAGSGSNTVVIIVVLVAIGAAALWKKQQGGAKPADVGGIYGDAGIYGQNVSEHVDDSGAKHVTIKAPGAT